VATSSARNATTSTEYSPTMRRPSGICCGSGSGRPKGLELARRNQPA
jgi:hypothetical protein